MFRSLRVRNYRMFAAGGAVSNIGTWLQRTAQDWLVLELTNGSAAALGTATALQFLPMLLFGMFGGVLADRYPKRPILITAQSLMAALALSIGVLTMTGAAQVWHVYVMAFTLGLISCVEVPTRQAFVVEMVGGGTCPTPSRSTARSSTWPAWWDRRSPDCSSTCSAEPARSSWSTRSPSPPSSPAWSSCASPS